MSQLLEDADGGVIALGGGAVCSERVREALGRHVVVWLQVSAEEAWRRVEGSDRPLAQDRDRFEALHAEREPIYAELADAILPPGDEEMVARALPALLGLRELPRGTRMAWASSDSGEYPAYVGEGLLGGGLLAARGPALLRHATRRSPGSTREAVRAARGAGGGGAGRAREDARRGRARPARAGAARDVARRPPGGAGRRRGRRPGRLLRGDLPARGRGRAGADHAGRPGRLRLRGQDRGRPARGQELRRRLPPAERRDRRHGDARHPAGRGAGGGLRRGGEDGADRRRAAVGAGAGARASSIRRSSAR